ncbi:MAG TPA: alpha/beta fold hydrolase, partial [Minicystis sp.]|nr:alpha/beta fold hydrolase [Minicystis sp.]
MADEHGGPRRRQKARARAARRWLRASAANAIEVARLGRLGPAVHEAFEVVDRDRVQKLRRYGDPARATSAPVLLIPPLMLTAEIYDVSPELSAVSALVARGVDTWVVDFGAPEREEGGMSRTLDDHVRAVSRAIDRVRALAGRDVHLVGYSQGGMFAYQAAAYRRSEGVASIVTFGSPVDIHKSVPNVSSDVIAVVTRAARPLLTAPLQRIEGLPGVLTSTGFKLLTPRKEIEQLFDFVKKLHDRKALERRETRRRFLGGEGFVAWPGPALRTFVEELIVHNRMLSGGMVIGGRTVTLADITKPVLAFVGDRDTFARPAAVRAIARAAPLADVRFVDLEAGHFGLVVGSRAMRESWPTVAAWVRFCDGDGPLPRQLAAAAADGGGARRASLDDEPEGAEFDLDVEIDFALDVLAAGAGRLWRRAGELVRDAAESASALRFQVPRLTQLERMTDETPVGPSRALAEQAREIPARTFFLWNGRAFSYADADARVGHVARGLVACGVAPGAKVAVVMAGRPSFLSVVTALARVGAVAVVLPPDATRAEIEHALAESDAARVVADPERARDVHAITRREVLVLGGGAGPRDLGEGLVDMEAIDPAKVELPAWYRPDPGVARDVAMILALRAGAGLRLVPITNHRWALSAIGAAAACTLRPDDTVYCCLPLHHPAGLLVSVGSALASGARLALAPAFDEATFWSDVRRYGATVAFYAGEMLRPLADAPIAPHERDHPLRLFAGSGMRAGLWRRLEGRFGAGVLEFYASTAEPVVLANASGKKVGAIGRPLPGSAEIALARVDLARGEPVRDASGALVAAETDEIGLATLRAAGREVVSGDLLRRDADGDFWFVDRLAGLVRTPAGPVSSRKVEDALYTLAEVRLAAAHADADG